MKDDETDFVIPALVCRSGLKLSVQASRRHYCTPRTDEGPWTHVEVMASGCDLRTLGSLRPHHDTGVRGLYGYVPVATVLSLVDEHGGVDEENCPYQDGRHPVLWPA